MTAKNFPKKPQRILILGNSGSGKSTLACKIGDLYDLPVIHLDAHFFGPNWCHPNPQHWQETISQLVQKDTWVMDGQRNNLAMRVQRAQVVIYLDFSTFCCLWRVVKRRFMQAQFRAGRPHDCQDRLTWAFLLYAVTFNRKRKQMLETIHQNREGREIYVLKGRAQVKSFEKVFLEKIAL